MVMVVPQMFAPGPLTLDDSYLMTVHCQNIQFSESLVNKDTAVRYVVDAQGQPQGVFLEQEMWQHVCKHVLSVLDKLFPTETEIAEPLADLQLLEKYWDLRYELPTDVACETCGASSADWKADEPRKFVLRAANMGGLLAFQCVSCKSRITKRHFKDKVTVTCAPHLTCACD
jgi:hypothetical protein